MCDPNMNLRELTVHEEDSDVFYTITVTQDQYERAFVDQAFVVQLIAAAREANMLVITPATNNEDIDNTRTGQSELDSTPSTVTSDEDIDNNRTGRSELETTPSTVTNDDNNNFIWKDNVINLLLTVYEEKKGDFQDKRHKKVFDEIATKMNMTNSKLKVTGAQCQTKINGLKKTYKKIIDHNNTTGNNRASWPFYERMDEIFGTTRWARPAATASEAGPSVAAEEAVATVTAGHQSRSKSGKRKLDSVLEEYIIEKKKYMAERHAMKKENAERLIQQRDQHHKEKLELLRALLDKNN